MGYRGPFTSQELTTLQLKLTTGQAFAVASDNEALIEGAHASALLYVYDESKAIPDKTWDAVEGAFANAGEETGKVAYAFAISTPGPPIGRFYDICSRKPGYEDWATYHITLEEAIREGRISRKWAEQRRKQWGEKSPLYRRRVLGEFAEEEINAVIYLSWVEEAQERWRERTQDGKNLKTAPLVAIGVDPAGEEGTGDEWVISILLEDWTVPEIIRHKRTVPVVETVAHMMEGIGLVVNTLKAYGGDKTTPLIIDSIGVGAGVVSRFREMGYNVIPFNGAAKTDRTDRSGEFRFVNQRSAGYWALREFLDGGEEGIEVALPPDPDIPGQLSAMTYTYTSTGAIKLESKDKVKERIGRSPDVADAVMYVFQFPAMKGRVGIV